MTVTTLAREILSQPAGSGPVTYGEPIQVLGIGTERTLSFTGTSAQTATAFSNHCSVIRVLANQDCHISIGADPTATTAHFPLVAGQEYYLKVVGGTSKLAALQMSTAGTLWIAEMV